MAGVDFIVGVLAFLIAGMCCGSPVAPEIEGIDDLAKLGLRFEFGNEDSSSEDTYTEADRPGDAVETHACDQVTSVPSELTFITKYGFYQKYTHAYGIPVVGSASPSDESLKRACYVLRFLLADRRILRHFLYKYYGRIGIMATGEVTRSIPEHSFLPSSWDSTRGIAGTISVPMTSGAEENLLCSQSDRHKNEDMSLHQIARGIMEIAVRGGGISGFWEKLHRQYAYAKSQGLWRNTVAMYTAQEYFAEGVQSFFDVNGYADPPDGTHGPINTRSKLQDYDPGLFKIIVEVFPCQNTILDRCKKGEPIPDFKMNCDGDKPHTQAPTQPPTPPPTTTRGPTTVPIPTTEPKDMNCTDSNEHCKMWAAQGFCAKDSSYVRYMIGHCSESCSCCKNEYDSCPLWKRGGYCNIESKYKEWMEKHCIKSCKVCQKIMISDGFDDLPPPMV